MPRALLTVVNQRQLSTVRPQTGQTVIKVDRTHPVLGNRHPLNNPYDLSLRRKVIQAYAEDLQADKAVNGPITRAIATIAQRLKNGEPIALACWCAPLPCHADLIKKAIEELVQT